MQVKWRRVTPEGAQAPVIEFEAAGGYRAKVAYNGGIAFSVLLTTPTYTMSTNVECDNEDAKHLGEPTPFEGALKLVCQALEI